MQWWEETGHTLVVMHDWKQQKQLEDTIRDLVRLAVEQARLEGYEEGLASLTGHLMPPCSGLTWLYRGTEGSWLALGIAGRP